MSKNNIYIYIYNRSYFEKEKKEKVISFRNKTTLIIFLFEIFIRTNIDYLKL